MFRRSGGLATSSRNGGHEPSAEGARMNASSKSAAAATEATSSALRCLTDSIDAFERAGASVPMHLDGQLQDGEWAALAQRVQRLAHRVSKQVEALDRATRQRRDLLVNVSHDLRTPLA